MNLSLVEWVNVSVTDARINLTTLAVLNCNIKNSN